MIEWEIDELACAVCGKNEAQAEQIINDSEIDKMLYEKYEISDEQYYNIIKDLMPFLPLVQAGISGNTYHAFVHPTEPRMIVRQVSAKGGGK